jgi:hypothetical protein
MTKEYTKRERQMFVRQLKKARPLIENDYEFFVCLALDESSGSDNTVKVKSMISNRLDNNVFVSGWLQQFHPEVALEIAQRKQWKEYRLAWIDNMIEEFSK